MAKKKVLLVDDEKSFTTLLKLNLEETGAYEVRVENWAEDAVAAAREFRPDIILLDIIMPRMPGGNVAALLKADPALKDIPVVFLTAAVRKQQVEEAEGIICDLPCLVKPASLDEIVQTIEKYT
jgi:CheY-like chemotaxis protein